MRKSIVYISLGIILAGALAGAFVANTAAVATGNGVEILAGDLKQQLDIFTHYSKVIREAQGLPAEPDAAFVLEVRRLALDSLIEQQLVFSELLSREGEAEVELGVKAKLAASTSTATLADAVEALYGVSAAEFESAVLVPIARQELLLDSFGGEAAQLDSWLVQARQQAAVMILISDLAWNGTEVVKNEQ